MLKLKCLMGLILIILAFPSYAFSSSLENDLAAFNLIPDFKILFYGSAFVILMQAGFAVAEGGYEHNLRSIYRLMINYISAILGTILFEIIFSKLAVWEIRDSPRVLNDIQGWHWNLLFFYMLMATTITTVVGRIIPSTSSILVNWITGLMIAMVIFPFFSAWVWGSLFFGDGWLKVLGFIDFAGSTVVHSTAAWIVLAAYLSLKAKYKQEIIKKDLIFEDYKILSLALAGFVLWLAWSGLNVIYISAIHVDISQVVMNAVLALLGSIVSPLLFPLFLNQKIMSWSELIKATLGGLVAITASCAFVSPSSAFIIGLVSGLLTLYTPRILVRWIDSRYVRDVLVVHGVCGIWGTLAVAFNHNSALELIGKASLMDQSIGIIVNFIWSFGIAYVVFKSICWITTRKQMANLNVSLIK
ncbi:ammonium transporter [Acinetobacter sp. P8-3-8]|uniref:ammonium transporter n=1 Tax=Acinetobacter sp. P8-3-8 TaxID=1029823 RepID=UPI000248606B|nr:Amt [Acinetobacter sp. P8-3-8]